MCKKILFGIVVAALVLGAATVCFAQVPSRAEGDESTVVSRRAEPQPAMPTEARYVGVSTDTGSVREHNEDSYGVFREAGVYLVADGMGGHQAGEVASALAVEWIGKYVRSPIMKYLRAAWPEQSVSWLEMAYREAHQVILGRSRANFSERGMGTTAVSLLTTSMGVWIVNLGDSRAYRVRGEAMIQISHDHSLVQDLIDAGKLRTPEEIARFPYKNIITRVMGTEGDSESDSFYDKPRAGDVYVLCSDGLTNEVEELEIAKIVRKHGTELQAAADELVETAKRNGGHDNITVILIMM